MAEDKPGDVNEPEEPTAEAPAEEQPAEEPPVEEQQPAAEEQPVAEAPAEPEAAPPRSPRRPPRPESRPPSRSPTRPRSSSRATRSSPARSSTTRSSATPRVKPEIPGADLEVDIVREDDVRRGESRWSEEDDEELSGEEGEESDDAEPQPIADAAIDLAAGARYTATGKRKTAVARVILKPGTGAYEINGRTLEQHFPRNTLQRNIRQPLETVGYESRMDVVALMHGGGVSAQAGALRHGISRALLEADPEPAVRAQAPRLPHARRAREGTQEGRPQEGPQEAAVLEEVVGPAHLAVPVATRKLFGTDGVRGVAGEFLSAELALSLARAATARVQGDAPARVLVIRDTRESGEMLEAAVAAGIAAAGGEALLGGVLPTPGAPLLIEPLRVRPRGRAVGVAQPVPGQRHQVLRRRRLQALRRRRAGDRGDAGGARAGAPGSGACAASTARSRTTCAPCTSASPRST